MTAMRYAGRRYSSIGSAGKFCRPIYASASERTKARLALLSAKTDRLGELEEPFQSPTPFESGSFFRSSRASSSLVP